jgi:cell wall assembly regulator SMI1
MRDLWDRLEAHLRIEAPDVLPTLRPPTTDAAIAAAEAALGLRFPADLIASLRIHDGQVQETRSVDTIPLVPAEFDRNGNDIATWGELAPLEHIVESTNVTRQMLDVGSGMFETHGPVRPGGKPKVITIVDAGSGDVIALDLAPDAGGAVGQVVAISHDPPSIRVIAASYREWFELLVERYEAGRYFIGEQEGLRIALDRWDPNADADDEDGDDDDDDEGF